jgi:hypothetical protein
MVEWLGMKMDDDSRRMRSGRPGRIVGSWRRRGLRSEVLIPVNVERVLMAAAKDDVFLELLFTDREAACSRYALTASERGLLRALPDDLLRRTIERLGDSRTRVPAFTRQAAAATTGLMLISALGSSCEGGCAPDDMGDDSADADTDSDSDADADADLDVDADTDTGPDADGGADGGIDGGPDGGSDGGA